MLDMMPYEVKNHYWFVGADTTRVYSSASKSYVSVTDVLFMAWISSGNFPSNVSSEMILREVFAQQYPEGWPVDYQQLLVVDALDFTDVVANRCFKAGVAFPPEWKTYVDALRAVYHAVEIVELPDPPLNADGSLAYPEGT